MLSRCGRRRATSRSGRAARMECARAAEAGLLGLVLLAWQLAVLLGLPEYILSPLQIIRFFWEALGTAELYENVGASLARALPGFVIGSALGVALGLAAGVSRIFDGTFSP